MKIKIEKIDRYGDLIFDITEEEILNIFSLGDILEVKINDELIDIPLCLKITDVVPGKTHFYFEFNKLVLGILNGNFASSYKIGEYEYLDDEIHWNILIDHLEINLKEKGTYKDILELMSFNRSNNIEDYKNEEIFGNFRKINNMLYRSSSPINNLLGRNEYVDKLLRKYQIKSIINLTDSNKKIKDHLNKNNASYYKELFLNNNVLPLNTNTDLISDLFRKQISDGLRFIIDHEGPYLIHCLDGKDRTGFVIFLLMSLLSYDKELIEEDYLKTYLNYYHLDKNGKQYLYLKDNALDYFYKCLGKDDKEINNYEFARRYLLNGGLTDKEIDLIIYKLNI